MRVELRAGTRTREGEAEEAVLGRGGEGSIYPLRGANLVLKRYHPDVLLKRGDELEGKLRAMLLRRPGTRDLCWPEEMAYEGGKFIGYTQARINIDETLTWAVLSNAGTRRDRAGAFGVAHAIRACGNAASALAAAHAVGVVLGDINESNWLVFQDSRVVIVDCDSAQVRDDSRVYRCGVGKAEYTAPELVGGSFSEKDRTPASDIFAFGVLVFQMLTGGAHPFDGIPLRDDVDPPTLQERIAGNLSPFLNPQNGVLKRADRVPVEAFPVKLMQLLSLSLTANPEDRPSALDWYTGLSELDRSIQPCASFSTHARFGDTPCAWCQHRQDTGADPFGPKVLAQTPLDPIGFSEKSQRTTGTAAQGLARSVPAGGLSQGGMSYPPGTAANPWPGQASYLGAGHQAQSGQVYGQSGAGQDPDVVEGGWLSIFFRYPGRTINHVLAKYPLLDRLAPDGSGKALPAIAMVGIGLLTSLVWWALCWVGVANVHSFVSGGFSRLAVEISALAWLGGILCALGLGIVWLVGAQRAVGGLANNSSWQNGLRLGICMGPGGIFALVALVLWAIYSLFDLAWRSIAHWGEQ